MNQKRYEQIKFALAQLVRSGQLIATERETDSKKKHDAEQPWRNLLVRLADDRFTVVFVGRFNRGKSFLNECAARNGSSSNWRCPINIRDHVRALRNGRAKSGLLF